MGHVVSSGGGGFLGYLQGYYPRGWRGVGGRAEAGDKEQAAEASTDTASDKAQTPAAPAAATTEEIGVGQEVKSRASVMYPVSTLVVVAVIAFLLGSLLRSLISPADFVYVGHEGGGSWREIRRLVEVKYVFGGWDLQIAAVRRHEG